MRVAGGVACAALVFALAGCGTDPAKTPQDVKGTVSLDGKPLPDGRVYFVPNGGGAPVVTEVKSGTFELKALPGGYKVEVRVFRDRVPWPGEPHDKQINVIPPRFNTETALSAEVKVGAANEFTFAVSTR
ncbi:MAG TPA: hypothetical protein VGE74_32960 [Gemmata sp.]